MNHNISGCLLYYSGRKVKINQTIVLQIAKSQVPGCLYKKKRYNSYVCTSFLILKL